MNEWFLVVVFALAGSAVSLIGGLYLLYGKRGAGWLQRISVPFAAGALLAASFFDLLPEAAETSESAIFVWALAGFLLFFVAERGLRWFHHHHVHASDQDQANRSLIVIGDIMHNFIDGLAIGASFLVGPATGIVTTLAVATHEIPQEIGDFGLLLKKGMARKQIVRVNAVSALATLAGAVLVFGFGDALNVPLGALLAMTAGFFIYIAASDIIPSIHQKAGARIVDWQTLTLILGVLFVGWTTVVLHEQFAGHPDEAGIHNSGAADTKDIHSL